MAQADRVKEDELECRECGAVVGSEDKKCGECGVDLATPPERKDKMKNPKNAAAKVDNKAGAGAKARVQPRLVRDDPKELEREEQVAQQKAQELKKAQQLQEIEEKIQKLHAEATRVDWQIGSHLRVIREKDLWRPTGAASFAEYVEMKFDFSYQSACDYMNVAGYFSRERAEKIGGTNLRILSHMANDEVREKMAKWVEQEEPTTRQLTERLKQERKALGQQTTRKGAKFEGTVLVNARLKVGPIFDGKWKTGTVRGDAKKTLRRARFKIGDVDFVLDDYGNDAQGNDLGFSIRMLDLNAAGS